MIELIKEMSPFFSAIAALAAIVSAIVASITHRYQKKHNENLDKICNTDNIIKLWNDNIEARNEIKTIHKVMTEKNGCGSYRSFYSDLFSKKDDEFYEYVSAINNILLNIKFKYKRINLEQIKQCLGNEIYLLFYSYGSLYYLKNYFYTNDRENELTELINFAKTLRLEAVEHEPFEDIMKADKLL